MERWERAPVWVQAVGRGVSMAVLMLVVGRVQESSWALIGSWAVISGVWFGASTAPAAARQRARELQVLDGDHQLRGAALVALHPLASMPSERRTLEAALQVTGVRTNEGRMRRSDWVLVICLLVPPLVIAIASAARWWVPVTVVVLILLVACAVEVASRRQFRRLQAQVGEGLLRDARA